MKRKPAFTLIELLLVTAIIALLGSLLLSALVRAKAQAGTTFCLNNLRQWALATQLYTADHGDFLPPEGAPNPGDNDTNLGWYIQLPAALGLPCYHSQPWRTNTSVEPSRSLWICPSNPRRSNGKNLFHYCLNERVNGTGANNHPVKLDSLHHPSAIVWLFDSKNLPAVGTENFVHTNLHGGGAQFDFLDAHVARFKNSEYWDFSANCGRTNNPSLVWIPN